MHPAAALQKCCCAAARLQQLLRLAPVASAAPAPSRRTHSHSTAAACLSSNSYEPLAYVSQPVQTAGEVPVPLCKRPGQHVEQLSALMEWRQSVLQQIANIKGSFQDADGGPSAAELQVCAFSRLYLTLAWVLYLTQHTCCVLCTACVPAEGGDLGA